MTDNKRARQMRALQRRIKDAEEYALAVKANTSNPTLAAEFKRKFDLAVKECRILERRLGIVPKSQEA